MNRLLSLILALFATSALAVDIPVRNPSSGGGINTLGATSGFQASVSDATTTAAAFKGRIGEYVACDSAASVALTSGWASYCNIVLTPGDWDISSQITFNGPAASINYVALFVSTTAGAGPTTWSPCAGQLGMVYSASGLGGATNCPLRVTVTANTTYYVNVLASANVASGGNVHMHARRVK